jgi:hypothetical protein
MIHYRDDKSTAVPMADMAPISKHRKASRSLLVVAIIVCIAVFGLFFHLGGISVLNQTTPILKPSLTTSSNSLEYYDDSDDPSWPDPPFNPIKRYSLEYGKVACWQHDGIWIARLSPVQLSFIGLDRFHDTERSLNQVDEDAFCARLRTHGASFWSLPPRWPENVEWCDDMDLCVEPDINVKLSLGFTESGGVWVLDTSQGWDYPKSLGLHNALTMEERCNVLKDLGAKFCESMQACPETAALLEPVEKALPGQHQTEVAV